MLHRLVLLAIFVAAFLSSALAQPAISLPSSLPLQIPNARPESTLTLSSGAATLARASHLIAAESGTADTVTSFVVTAFRAGATVKIAPDAGDTITIDAAISDTGRDFDLSGDQFAYVHVQAGGAYVVSRGGGGSSADATVINAADYGVVCDYNTGTLTGTNNTAAFRSMDADIEAAGNATIVLPGGNCLVYDTADTDAALWDIQANAVDNIKIISNGTKLYTKKDYHTSTNAYAGVFFFRGGVESLIIEGRLEFVTDIAGSPPYSDRGLSFFEVWEGIDYFQADLKCTGGRQCLRFTRQTNSDGVAGLARNLNFSIETDRTYYSVSTENTGYNVSAVVRSAKAGRSWIGGGMERVNASVFSKDNQVTEDVLWSCYNLAAQNDRPYMRDVQLFYDSAPRTASPPGSGSVTLRAWGSGACRMEGMDINVNHREDGTNKTADIFKIVKQAENQTLDDTGTDGHVIHFKNLSIRGLAYGPNAKIYIGGTGAGHASGNWTGEDIRIDNLVIRADGSASSQLDVLDSVALILNGSVEFPGNSNGLVAPRTGSFIAWRDTNSTIGAGSFHGNSSYFNVRGGAGYGGISVGGATGALFDVQHNGTTQGRFGTGGGGWYLACGDTVVTCVTMTNADVDINTRLEQRGGPVPYVLAQSAVAASHTGNTTETALATITIPAGEMGPNGWVEVYTLWSVTNNANNKTPRIRLGGIGGTAFYNLATANTTYGRLLTNISNRNSAASQIGMPADVQGWGFAPNAVVTATVNTANAQDLVISCQLATGTDTCTLEAYRVVVFYKS